ncbi:MAG: cytochrome c [Planctomycetes bacterium]|nr:cytochrome c [Planctomycetota bacterium]
MRRGACAVAALALLAGCLACASTAVRAPEISAEVAAAGLARGSDRATLESGREVFRSSCARCHALPRIGDHSAEEWPAIVDDMSRKSRLLESDTAALAAFIQACAAVDRATEG